MQGMLNVVQLMLKSNLPKVIQLEGPTALPGPASLSLQWSSLLYSIVPLKNKRD